MRGVFEARPLVVYWIARSYNRLAFKPAAPSLGVVSVDNGSPIRQALSASSAPGRGPPGLNAILILQASVDALGERGMGNIKDNG